MFLTEPGRAGSHEWPKMAADVVNVTLPAGRLPISFLVIYYVPVKYEFACASAQVPGFWYMNFRLHCDRKGYWLFQTSFNLPVEMDAFSFYHIAMAKSCLETLWRFYRGLG